MKNSKNCWTVYSHTTPSGKRYIGITSKKPEDRWQNGHHYKKCTAFRYAIDKYGWDNIQHNIVSSDLTETEAKWLENYLICYYRTFVGFKDCKGYNMTLGGEGKVGLCPTKETRRKQSEANKGKQFSEEHKIRLSESHKGKTPWKGKHHTEETRRKQSETKKGKQFSEEHKIRLSESHKGHQSPIKGKHWKLIDGKRVYYE